MPGIRHGYRQRYQLGRHLDMTHRDAGIATPHVHDGSATAVVGGVHAQIVFLFEVQLEGQDPVRALRVRAALVGPEGRFGGARGRGDRITVVGPAGHLQLRGSFVGVPYGEKCEAGELVVDRHQHGLLQGTGDAGEGSLPPGAQRIPHVVLCAAVEREVRHLRAVDRNGLGRAELPERDVLTVEPGEHAAVQRGVELEADVLPLDAHNRGRRQGGPRQKNAENAGQACGWLDAVYHRNFTANWKYRG